MDLELFKTITEYPFIFENKFYDSKKLKQNKTCTKKCKDKDCLNNFTKNNNEYICSKGYNNFLLELDKKIYIFNGLIFDTNEIIPKGRKEVRLEWIVKRNQLKEDIFKFKKIDLYIRQHINETMIKNLSMFHDFKSSMNIFFDCTQDIIHSLPGDNFEEKLNQSDKAYKNLYNALDLITSQLGMIDVVSNPKSITFGTKREISIYKLFDKIKYLFEHHRVTRKKNVSIEIFNTNHKYVSNSFCYDTIEFIPLILLDNALKYSSPYSKVTIEFTQYHKKVLIKVKNIGPFVKDENREKIFDKFYRGETGEDFTSQGLGVGLWIAQKILKTHNSVLKYDKDKYAEGDIGLNIFEFELDTI